MLDYCRDLQFEETPDYEYLYRLIQTIFKENEYEWDYKYDWMTSQAISTETSTKMLFTDVSKLPICLNNANKEENKRSLVIEKNLKEEQKQERTDLPAIIMEG